MSSDDEVREEKELDLSSNDVVTKYKAAAEILNSKFYLAFANLIICSVDLLSVAAACLGIVWYSQIEGQCLDFLGSAAADF